jgi:mRNA-degrading endonuclease YafQ of YafQ-DinJ toxin-antitoxin module
MHTQFHRFNRFLTSLLVLLALGINIHSYAQDVDIVGEWHGTYNINIGGDRDIVFALAEQDGVMTGVLNDPASGIVSMKIESITIEDGEVHFAIPLIAGEYFGTIHRDLGADGKPVRIDGDWSRAGEFVPITLYRKQ